MKNLTVEIPAVVVVVAPVVDHKSNFAELRVAGWYTRYLFDWQDLEFGFVGNHSLAIDNTDYDWKKVVKVVVDNRKSKAVAVVVVAEVVEVVGTPPQSRISSLSFQQADPCQNP